MRKTLLVALAVTLVVGIAVVMAAPPKATTAQPAPVVVAKPTIIAISPLQDVKLSCCGGSMSSARVCVDATLKNYGSSPVTYSTKFNGLKAGECVKWDKEYCKQHPPAPGGLCIDPCVQTAPPTPVVTVGPAVTVPAKGSAPLHIVAPNNFYAVGSKVEAQAPGAAPATAAVGPFSQCVL